MGAPLGAPHSELRLRQDRVQVGVVATNLWANRLDRGNRRRRNDPDQKPVLNQVLTGILLDEPNKHRLHRVSPCRSVWVTHPLPPTVVGEGCRRLLWQGRYRKLS